MAQSKPSYEDDDYEWIDHKNEAYSNIFNLRAREGLMIHEKMEEEAIYFTGSGYLGNDYGFVMHPERLHPTALREHERRSTSTAPNNKSKESLEVVIQRVCELLTLSLSHLSLSSATSSGVTSRVIMIFISRFKKQATCTIRIYHWNSWL